LQQQQQQQALQQQQQQGPLIQQQHVLQRGLLAVPPTAVTCGEGVLTGAACNGSPRATLSAAGGGALEGSGRGSGAGALAFPPVTSAPLNGGFRYVSHYHMAPPHFLIPCDPNGRSYPQHLTAMVRKVHLAEQRCRGVAIAPAAGPAVAAAPTAAVPAAAAAAVPPVAGPSAAGKLVQGGVSPSGKGRAAAPVITMVAGQPGSPHRTVSSAGGGRQPGSASALAGGSSSPGVASAKAAALASAVQVTAAAGIASSPSKPPVGLSTAAGGQQQAGLGGDVAVAGVTGRAAAAGCEVVGGSQAGVICTEQQPAGAGAGLAAGAAAAEPATPIKAAAAAALLAGGGGGGGGVGTSSPMAQPGTLAALPPHLALLLHQPGPLTQHSPGPSSPAVRVGDVLAPEAAAVLALGRMQLPGEPLQQQATGSASGWDDE
jgi:hypothetical protein